MTIAIYARVSTDEQVSRGNSIDTQIKRGIELCDLYDYEYEIYIEPGLSGASDLSDLPQLTKLLADLESKKVDGVAILEFSRISRNDKNWSKIKEVLESTGALLYIDGKDIDITDPDAELIINIQQNLAVHEVKRLKRRVKNGLRTGVSKGRVGGGRIQAFGYTKGKNKELIIEKDEAEVVKYIFELAVDGLGTKAISTKLNEQSIPTKLGRLKLQMKSNGRSLKDFTWKDGTVYGILTNSIYKGQRNFQGEFFESPVIIEEDVFDAVQVMLKDRDRFKETTNRYFYLLKGLLYCTCGRAMHGYIKPSRGMRVYKCNSKRGHVSQNCGNRGVNIDKLNSHVVSQLMLLPQIAQQSFEFYKKLDYKSAGLGDMIELKEEIKVLEERIQETIELSISKQSKEKAIKTFEERIRAKEKEIKRLDRVLVYLNNWKEFLNNIQRMTSTLSLDQLENETTQIVARSLIEKIEIWHVEDEKQFDVIIHFKVDMVSNIRLSSLLRMDDLKYSKLKNQVRFVHINTNTVANMDIGLDDDSTQRWVY